MLIHIPIQLDLKVHTESGLSVDDILDCIDERLKSIVDNPLGEAELVSLRGWIVEHHWDDNPPKVTVSHSVTTSQSG